MDIFGEGKGIILPTIPSNKFNNKSAMFIVRQLRNDLVSHKIILEQLERHTIFLDKGKQHVLGP